MSFTIKTDTPAYVYETMADHLAARIRSGEFKPNDPLPAERNLAGEYGVSLGTARRATEALRGRGLVFTLRSKGTFITDRTQQAQQPGTPHGSIAATEDHRVPAGRRDDPSTGNA